MNADPAANGSLSDATSTSTSPGRLARSAGLIGLATMASRVLGLVRDMVYATLFGAGDQMDAFNVAFRLPNLLRDMFAEGAMSAAFVPTFTRVLQKDGRDAAWQLGRRVITALMIATGTVALAGVVFAGPLTRLYAGDFALVPGKLELTITLTRIMFPFLVLVALAVAFMGMLNALRRFFVPALSPALFNVGAIVAALTFVPVMPALGLPSMAGLAIGVLFGGFLQAAVQWPLLAREGFALRPDFAPRDPRLHEVLLLMGPSTIGLAAVQVNIFVNTVLAAGEGTGAVSWLNFAFRLMYLPIGLFGVSVATAALPTLAGLAANDDLPGLRRTLSSGLRLMLMLNVPATVGLVALASPITALIFERGRFTAEDTAATAAALMCYAPGLVGYSAVKLVTPAFYAMRDSRTPVMVSMMSVGLNIVLNLVLVRVMGYLGLALGTAVASLLSAMTLLFLLRRRIGGIDGRRVGVALLKIAAAAMLMALVVVAAERGLQGLVPGRGLAAKAVQVFGAIGAGVIGLGLAARALRIAEFDEALAAALQRMRRAR
jgi:putative peptidoglycan lipid II flippase